MAAAQADPIASAAAEDPSGVIPTGRPGTGEAMMRARGIAERLRAEALRSQN